MTDKVIETKNHFSLFCTFSAIWKHLEAFGSIWKHFEAFGSIWKHLEADCFRFFGTVLTVKRHISEINSKASECFQTVSKSKRLWKHLNAL
jgi:hypothetical protein